VSQHEGTDELVARVDRCVAQAGVGVRVGSVAPLEGGHSGLTLAADLVAQDGSTRRIVLKAAPAGRAGVGRHDMIRQARLFQALGAFQGVRVPEVLFAEEADPPFFGMEFLDGEAVEPILDDVDLPAEVVYERSLRAADMLAALHAGDAGTIGIEDPRSIEQELERWSRTMASVDPELVPGGDDLRQRLEDSVPDERPPAVIHGDYRLGNILCRGAQLLGIIDWEIWTIADPRLDLGWFLAHFDAGNYPGIGHVVDVLPRPEEVLARYEQASGRPVDDWPWFDAFGRFKLAAIMAHNLRRHREGRHVDPFQERLPPTIRHLIRTGAQRLPRG